MSAATILSPTVDLSRLPAPAVVQALSYAEERARLIADFRARWPDFDALLESDPVIKLIETVAYQSIILRGALNDAARSVMIAFAVGTDLDQLAARFGVARLVITPATDTAPAVMESDAELRLRVQLAPESWAQAGMTGGGYKARILGAFPALRDVNVIKRGGGVVEIVLLGRAGTGLVDDATVGAVAQALEDAGGAQLTDILSVRSAEIVAYTPTITLAIRRGPDPQVVRAAAEAAVRAYAADRARVAGIVYAQRLEAAASVGGVERATVDIADVVPGERGAPHLAALTLIVEVLP